MKFRTKKIVKINEIESNRINLSKKELTFTQFDSILLNVTQIFAQHFTQVYPNNMISSKTDEKTVN